MYLNINPLRIEILPVTSIYQNCMMIWNTETKRAILSDPGGDFEAIVQLVDRKKVQIEAIFLTHGHFDHVAVTTELQKFLQTHYNCKVPVLGPSIEDQFLLNQVIEDANNFGVYIPYAANVIPSEFVNDEQMIEMMGTKFKVIHVPGHTPGHVVYYNIEGKFIIAGDVLFKGSIGRTDFVYGNSQKLVNTIKEKLLCLDDETIILPGHGPSTTIASEKYSNPFLI